jgi:hypothetical protein
VSVKEFRQLTGLSHATVHRRIADGSLRSARKRQRVAGSVIDIFIEGVPSISVTCSQCGQSAEVFGRDDRSVGRGCWMHSEQCASWNFYVHDEAVLAGREIA